MDMISGNPIEPVHHPKHIVAAILLAVAAILVVLLAYWLDVKWSSKGPKADVTMSKAKTGEVVAGFPQGLIVEPGAFVNHSYSLNYASAGVNQPVLSYVSSKTLAENIALFHALLAKEGWQIERDVNPKSAVTSIYATKGGATLNIVFNAQPGKPVGVIEAYAVSTK